MYNIKNCVHISSGYLAVNNPSCLWLSEPPTLLTAHCTVELAPIGNDGYYLPLRLLSDNIIWVGGHKQYLLSS